MNKLKEALKKKILSKSEAAHEALEGKDMGKKGKKFEQIASVAAKKYGSKEAGERIAGAIFQNLRKKGKL